jgi:hypothetical protein
MSRSSCCELVRTGIFLADTCSLGNCLPFGFHAAFMGQSDASQNRTCACERRQLTPEESRTIRDRCPMWQRPVRRDGCCAEVPFWHGPSWGGPLTRLRPYRHPAERTGRGPREWGPRSGKLPLCRCRWPDKADLDVRLLKQLNGEVQAPFSDVLLRQQ